MMGNWTAVRRVLFLTVFIDLLGFGVAVPVLAFCAKQYGASGATLGLILGSFSLMQFFFSPVLGTALGPHRPPAGDRLAASSAT